MSGKPKILQIFWRIIPSIKPRSDPSNDCPFFVTIVNLPVTEGTSKELS
jgi:hypothetical protein